MIQPTIDSGLKPALDMNQIEYSTLCLNCQRRYLTNNLADSPLSAWSRHDLIHDRLPACVSRRLITNKKPNMPNFPVSPRKERILSSDLGSKKYITVRTLPHVPEGVIFKVIEGLLTAAHVIYIFLACLGLRHPSSLPDSICKATFQLGHQIGVSKGQVPFPTGFPWHGMEAFFHTKDKAESDGIDLHMPKKICAFGKHVVSWLTDWLIACSTVLGATDLCLGYCNYLGTTLRTSIWGISLP